MELLKWKPSYALGIPSVDHEHQEMIVMINRAYGLMAESSSDEAIESCLEDIYAGIASHFALEERHMKQAGYTEYEAHKEQHEDLLDQIRDIMDEYYADPVSGQKTLQDSLADWFEQHFATFDARLHHKLGDHHG